MIELPNKKYNIIYADPPWHYNDRRNTHTKFSGGALGHYNVMKTEEICKIPVNDIADDNCILFMWATFPNLPDALKVIQEWGFTYKTLGFSWIKTNKNNGKYFFGIGYYTKSNAEVCLIATKGKLKPISNYVFDMKARIEFILDILDYKRKECKKNNEQKNGGNDE